VRSRGGTAPPHTLGPWPSLARGDTPERILDHGPQQVLQGLAPEKGAVSCEFQLGINPEREVREARCPFCRVHDAIMISAECMTVNSLFSCVCRFPGGMISGPESDAPGWAVSARRLR
jgi:hypothetical protein